MQSSPGNEAGDQVAAPQEDELRAELARMEDRYKRALADLDNYRKRSAAEIDRRALEGRLSLLRDWLEPLDSLERAVRLDPGNPAAPGLQALLEQMESILARQGVQRIGAPGEEFDFDRHEAIGTRETGEAPDRTVVDVARSGYVLGDRVLRPAQVVVARAPQTAD